MVTRFIAISIIKDCLSLFVCSRTPPRQSNVESSNFHRLLKITQGRTSLPYFWPSRSLKVISGQTSSLQGTFIRTRVATFLPLSFNQGSHFPSPLLGRPLLGRRSSSRKPARRAGFPASISISIIRDCLSLSVCSRTPPRPLNVESSKFHRLLKITQGRSSLPYFWPSRSLKVIKGHFRSNEFSARYLKPG